jgi:hypothetical protein
MGDLTQTIKHLEAAFGKMVAASRKAGTFSGEDGLAEDLDVVHSLGQRAVWMRIEELENAEETYRENAALAARNRGVETARLEVQAGEEPGTMRFGLVIPAAKRFQEDRLMQGLQHAINNIVGGMVVEQQIMKLNIMRILQHLGRLIKVWLKNGNDEALVGVADAMAEMKGDQLASILNTLVTVTAIDNIIEDDADSSDG